MKAENIKAHTSYEDYVSGIKQDFKEFAEKVSEEEIVNGVICIVDMGEGVGVQYIGSKAVLKDMRRGAVNHILGVDIDAHVVNVNLNKIGMYVSVFGLGVLAGMFLGKII
jgi:hypothetical protein